jgi:hypothetical protein
MDRYQSGNVRLEIFIEKKLKGYISEILVRKHQHRKFQI